MRCGKLDARICIAHDSLTFVLCFTLFTLFPEVLRAFVEQLREKLTQAAATRAPLALPRMSGTSTSYDYWVLLRLVLTSNILIHILLVMSNLDSFRFIRSENYSPNMRGLGDN